MAPWRLSCLRQYWHRAPAHARTVRDSSAGTFITAACLESARPRRARAITPRSIQPATPVLPFPIPAKRLHCCGPSVPEDDDPSSMGNGDFPQPLPSQSARQLLNSPCQLKTPGSGCQQRGRLQPWQDGSRGWRTWPSSAALDREMTAWGRGCKACHGRHVVWHRHSCLCSMYGRHPPWSQARVPVPPHRAEHPRWMARRKPLRTRGQMTSHRNVAASLPRHMAA